MSDIDESLSLRGSVATEDTEFDVLLHREGEALGLHGAAVADSLSLGDLGRQFGEEQRLVGGGAKSLVLKHFGTFRCWYLDTIRGV